MFRAACYISVFLWWTLVAIWVGTTPVGHTLIWGNELPLAEVKSVEEPPFGDEQKLNEWAKDKKKVAAWFKACAERALRRAEELREIKVQMDDLKKRIDAK